MVFAERYEPPRRRREAVGQKMSAGGVVLASRQSDQIL
jgi:hypothetical protein